MTTRTPTPTTTSPRQTAPYAVRPASYLEAARTRDFGIGYGRSSGYATGRRYASNWGSERFHCG